MNWWFTWTDILAKILRHSCWKCPRLHWKQPENSMQNTRVLQNWWWCKQNKKAWTALTSCRLDLFWLLSTLVLASLGIAERSLIQSELNCISPYWSFLQVRYNLPAKHFRGLPLVGHYHLTFAAALCVNFFIDDVSILSSNWAGWKTTKCEAHVLPFQQNMIQMCIYF